MRETVKDRASLQIHIMSRVFLNSFGLAAGLYQPLYIDGLRPSLIGPMTCLSGDFSLRAVFSCSHWCRQHAHHILREKNKRKEYKTWIQRVQVYALALQKESQKTDRVRTHDDMERIQLIDWGRSKTQLWNQNEIRKRQGGRNIQKTITKRVKNQSGKTNQWNTM